MKMDQSVQEQVMWPAQNVMIYISSDAKWWREYVFKKGTPYAIYSPCYINDSNYCQKWNEQNLIKLWWIVYHQDQFCMQIQNLQSEYQTWAHMKCYSLIYIEMCYWTPIQP